MEHRPLDDQEAVQAVRANTLTTYLGLVEPISGAVVSKPHGFTLVRGPGPFSFCNFAAGFDSEDTGETLSLLVEQARDCAGFYVFVMSGDQPWNLEKLLLSGGFEIRQELTSMVWKPSRHQPGGDLDHVTDHEDRLLVAGFMVEQFFWRLPKEARAAIAAATAASRHHLYKVGDMNEPKAAVMLVPTPGSIGLYNLCVRPELRGQGTGRAVVESIKDRAAGNGTKVVLQCESALVPWYQSLEFGTVGKVRAYTYAGTISSDDILRQ